ncbi:MAG: LysM peptidoglycan-binding domain-containing protein [Bacilli bacterium]|nr:LysM peptidoglycan-binding domain-containing protein [Bacilli bacterium]
MKKIVPFKKELFFKDNIAEVTSISLEHSLHKDNNSVTGEFYINGEYKVTNVSSSVDRFEFTVPFEIALDEKYDTKNAIVDIDDFYYEIFDSNVLLINVEVRIDKLEEVREIIEFEEEEPIIFKEEIKKVKEYFHEEEIKTTKNEYVTYKIYIVKENDTLDTILETYNVDKEELSKYNVLDSIKIGDKIIIPYYD